MADSRIKPMAFSGAWYPGSPNECRAAIRDFLKRPVKQPGRVSGRPVGGIVPHAGWAYSGEIACKVIAALAPEADAAPVDTVLLFGAHMHAGAPAFILGQGAVETPLGNISVDREVTEETVAGLSRAGIPVQVLAPDHFPDENTLELQYPFIRHFFPDSRIVVCGVPPVPAAGQAGEAAVRAAAGLGRTIRVVGSTDMTHYGPNFGFEPKGRGEDAVDWVRNENDAAAIRALEKMDVDAILDHGIRCQSMCCAGAAAAAAKAAQKAGAQTGVCLAYATSREISRSDSFVGYCGMVYI